MNTEFLEAEKSLTKAKIALMDDPDCTFYGSVFFSAKHIWDRSLPTAATDGLNIFFNPEFFLKQSPEQRIGLIIHETEHIAFKHMARLGDRDPIKANIAADHVINLGLLKRNFKLPAGGLWDPQYEGLCYEEVYDRLPDDPPEDYSPDLIPNDDPELDEQINDVLVRAAMQTQAAGGDINQIPGELQVYLDQLLHPRLPWQQILLRHCNSIAKTDYSFNRPNRRFFPDILLPSLHSANLGHVGAALDMSGSVTDQQSTMFATEVHSLLQRMKPKEISLVQFDTEIKSVTTLRNKADLLRVTYHGRGGTLIEPVFEWAEKARPSVLIIFTDGQFHFPKQVPKLPIVWVIHNNKDWQAPFGKTIHFPEFI